MLTTSCTNRRDPLALLKRELQGKGRLEDPERSGVIFFFHQNRKQKGRSADPERSGMISVLFLKRNCIGFPGPLADEIQTGYLAGGAPRN
jgi:hypothetical protein